MGTNMNYIAGALIANAVVWIGAALIPLPADASELFLTYITAYFIISMVGGAIGGYMVARKTLEISPLRLGLVLGAMSYAILAVANWFMGVRAWVDSSALIGFSAGFAVGIRMIELRRIGQRKVNRPTARSPKP